MFSRKPFVKLGTIMTAVAAGLFFASGAFVADSATAGLGPLSAQATGTAVTDSGGCTTPTISCARRARVLCMTGTYSITGNNGFNGGTASLTLGIDITNLGDPITAVPPCAPATGVGTISDKKGHQTITFLASGPVCSTINNNRGRRVQRVLRDQRWNRENILQPPARALGASASFLSVTTPGEWRTFAGVAQRQRAALISARDWFDRIRQARRAWQEPRVASEGKRRWDRVCVEFPLTRPLGSEINHCNAVATDRSRSTRAVPHCAIGTRRWPGEQTAR